MENQFNPAFVAKNDNSGCSCCCISGWQKKMYQGAFFYQICLKNKTFNDWLGQVAQVYGGQVNEEIVVQ